PPHLLNYGLSFFLRLRRALSSTLFPYTTLFRSPAVGLRGRGRVPLPAPAGSGPGAGQGRAGRLLRGTNLRELRPVRRRRSAQGEDRKSTRLNSSHGSISYAVFCLKKKT